MALQKTVNFRGITVADAYLRIGVATVTKQNINYFVSYHKDAESESFNETSHQASHDLNGDNAIKQAYLHALSLPEFAGAVEV